MKYLKLFESYEVDKREYPEHGHELNPRENIILKDLVGSYYFRFNIKKDDGYYYTNLDDCYNRFDNFNALRDYIQFRYLIWKNSYNSYNGILTFIKKSKIDPSFDDNLSIRWASTNGYLEIVKLLLQDPRVDPSADNNYAIRMASENGYLEIFKVLLEDPRVDPSDCDNYSIRVASKNGHVEIVKLLLEDPRVDPSVDNNYALRKASRNGHREIFKLLSKDPRVHNSLHLW